MVVGVTGKYCAGKNSVAALLESQGFRHIDADKLGHDALERQRARIEQRFGSAVVNNGLVNRRALAAIVFSDAAARSDLEAIVHPEVVAMVKRRVAEDPSRDYVINAPLLYKAGLQLLCRVVIWVTAPVPVRLYRGVRRDHSSVRSIMKRIRSQGDLKPSQHSAGDVDIIKVNNVCGRNRLTRRVERIVKLLRNEDRAR
ncbi:MAG TPA: dephospho-CoA kinase [Spirochaetia bacterium]|nr:dephospho-CoA kinase [Spirochaetia bacterium]